MNKHIVKHIVCPSKSGLIHKHIVKHIAPWLVGFTMGGVLPLAGAFVVNTCLSTRRYCKWCRQLQCVGGVSGVGSSLSRMRVGSACGAFFWRLWEARFALNALWFSTCCISTKTDEHTAAVKLRDEIRGSLYRSASVVWTLTVLGFFIFVCCISPCGSEQIPMPWSPTAQSTR